MTLKERKAYLEYLKAFYRMVNSKADESGLMIDMEKPGAVRYTGMFVKDIRHYCLSQAEKRNKQLALAHIFESDPLYHRFYPLWIDEFVKLRK